MTGPGRTGGAPGDLTAITAADPGIIVTNGTGPIPSIGQRVGAEEDRIYAVDFVKGLDTNAGYAVLPVGANAAQYAAACVAAGLVAKKTIGGSALIRPPAGNNHIAELVIANGGSNTVQAYTEDLGLWLNSCTGYANLSVRATGTNATAGAVAFDGSTTDATYQGGITATGCNTAGYNPIAAFSTSVIKCLKVGGGAAAIPVEPAAPLGWRIRFDSATTTVALRNVCRQICEVVGTDTLTVQTVLPAAPVGTDTFYLEMAGVTIPASRIGGLGLSAANISPYITGLRCTGTLTVKDCSLRFSFMGCNAFVATSSGVNSLLIAQAYAHPILGALTSGGGLRIETNASINTATLQAVTCLVVVTTLTVFATTAAIALGLGCYCGALLSQGVIQPAGTTTGIAPNFGAAAGTALAAPRIVGASRARILTSQFSFGVCSILSAGAAAAISVEGRTVLSFNGVVSGATGNNDVGMDLTLARGAGIILTTTPTVTGALGDIRLAGGQIITWAQAIATGIQDSAGNRIIGTTGIPPMGMDTKSGAILSGVAAATSWVADDSWVVAVAAAANNNVFQQRWPTSLRLMMRLRLMLCNPEPTAQAVSATLCKNGVATTMTCTLPIGSMNFDKVVDAAHPILFLDGDDWAVRLDTGIMGAEGPTLYLCTATIEWAA